MWLLLNSSTSCAVDLNFFNENRLKLCFRETISAEKFFNINLAPAKNTVESPEHRILKPLRIIEGKDSSQETYFVCQAHPYILTLSLDFSNVMTLK